MVLMENLPSLTDPSPLVHMARGMRRWMLLPLAQVYEDTWYRERRSRTRVTMAPEAAVTLWCVI